jgi:dTDP-4-dehydrorhamnose reductase
LNTKVLILGSSGLIGHQIHNYLDNYNNFNLSNISYSRKLNNETLLLDARNEKLFINQIKLIKPSYIVNCIGFLISQSNNDPEGATIINAELPHKLDKLAVEINAKLIHISTDCVFSGEKNQPYVESDFKDGKDTYSLTKALGEVVNKKHLTLRTSVVGPELKIEGQELFHWFMMEKSSIKGFTKAIWSGVTTLELAKAVKWAIDNNITGLYHITNNQIITKNDLLNLFKKYTKKDIEIIPSDSKIINKSFIDTRCEIDYEIPSYDKMISEMISFMRKNRNLYNHYSF